MISAYFLSCRNYLIPSLGSVRSDLILANDPDADRLGVAVRNANGNGWDILRGDEIGAILASYIWETGKCEKAVMLASSVSSKLLETMAMVEGFTFKVRYSYSNIDIHEN